MTQTSRSPQSGPYTLYGRQNSGSLVVEVALEEIGVPFELVSVTKDAEDVARFSLINPTGKVPALRLPDGTMLFESAAILIHLAQAHPDAHLAPPPQSRDYAQFLQWMVYLAANPYQSVLRIYYPERYSPRGLSDAPSIREQAINDFVSQMRLVSNALNPYVLGATCSIADTYLHMLTSWYPGDQEDLFAQLAPLRGHAKLLAARPVLSKVLGRHAT